MSIDKLSTIRKPRVHIKYEVETEHGVVEKDLPFVVGVIGDYAGNNPGVPLKNIKDRKFINIDNDSFDQVMAKQKPGLRFAVPNMLANDNTEMNIELQFKSMSDFEPESIVEQIPALRALKDSRDKLRDLVSKTDRSDQLEILLEEILQNSEKLKILETELNNQSNQAI